MVHGSIGRIASWLHEVGPSVPVSTVATAVPTCRLTPTSMTDTVV
jgi:hypothetical protein